MPRSRIAALFVMPFLVALGIGADVPKLTRESVIGVWRGTDDSGLKCRVEFDRTHGRVITFKAGKHVTTVNFWWNIDRSRTNIVLGVSGNAHALKEGELQLRLRPVNTNLLAVRDVILKRQQEVETDPRAK